MSKFMKPREEVTARKRKSKPCEDCRKLSKKVSNFFSELKAAFLDLEKEIKSKDGNCDNCGRLDKKLSEDERALNEVKQRIEELRSLKRDLKNEVRSYDQKVRHVCNEYTKLEDKIKHRTTNLFGRDPAITDWINKCLAGKRKKAMRLRVKYLEQPERTQQIVKTRRCKLQCGNIFCPLKMQNLMHIECMFPIQFTNAESRHRCQEEHIRMPSSSSYTNGVKKRKVSETDIAQSSSSKRKRLHKSSVGRASTSVNPRTPLPETSFMPFEMPFSTRCHMGQHVENLQQLGYRYIPLSDFHSLFS